MNWRKTGLVCLMAALPFAVSSQTVREGDENIHWTDSVSAYKELAWSGNADAYWKLACCYRDGRGVEQDMMKAFNYAMLANERDDVKDPEAIFDELPDDNPYRILGCAMRAIGEKRYGKARQEGEKLVAMGYAGRELVNGSIARAKGRKTKALGWYDKAIGKGSRIALIAKASISEADEDLLAAAELMPWFYNELARNSFHHDEFVQEEHDRASSFFLKAYEELSLDLKGARWLYAYYKWRMKRGEMLDNPELMKRLKALAAMSGED